MPTNQNQPRSLLAQLKEDLRILQSRRRFYELCQTPAWLSAQLADIEAKRAQLDAHEHYLTLGASQGERIITKIDTQILCKEQDISAENRRLLEQRFADDNAKTPKGHQAKAKPKLSQTVLAAVAALRQCGKTETEIEALLGIEL